MYVNPAKKKMTPSAAGKVARNNVDPDDPVIGVYHQSVILATLKKYNGRIASTAKALKVSLQTMQKYIKKSKVLQNCVIEYGQIELDTAEQKLQEQVEKGNLAAIQFLLKCKGKERGWTEKTELSIDVKPITFKYRMVKPADGKSDGSSKG